MKARKGTSSRRGRRGIPGALRLALLFATLLASLSLVVWRQSRALEVLRQLDGLRTQRAMAESEKGELQRRIQMLESRSRVVTAARERLGLHVPTGSEIVILPLAPASGAAASVGVVAGGDREVMGSGEGGEAEPGGADARRMVTSVGGL